MKQTVKKLIAALALIAVAATAPLGAFAEDAATVTGVTAPVSVPANSVVVNGLLVEGAATYTNASGIMVPIRATAEAMGFVVGWDNGLVTLEKDAVYVTFRIGEDGYTFAKTAPMPLGQAPELVDEKTYVPAALFTDVLEVTLDGDGANGVFSVVYGEEAEEPAVAVQVTVKSVEADEEAGYTAVVVTDQDGAEVQLNLTDESDIVLADGSKGAPADIEEGMSLEVLYGEAMTKSIPPQNSPAKVTVLAAKEEEEKDEQENDDVLDVGLLVANQDGWVESEGSGTGHQFDEEGNLVVESTSSERILTSYKATKLPINQTVKMQMKVDYTGPDDEYIGVNLRGLNTGSFAWPLNEMYSVVIFKDHMELQYFTNGGHIFRTVNTGVFGDGAYHEMEFGATDTEEGVQLVCKVDGKTIFDYVDADKHIKTRGYFSVFALNVPLTLKKSEQDVNEAVISAIEENDVTVTDKILGKVVLHVTEDTEIVLADGSKGSISDLKEDMAIDVEYGEAMTMSIPPQNTPVKITVSDREVTEDDKATTEETPVADANEE